MVVAAAAGPGRRVSCGVGVVESFSLDSVQSLVRGRRRQRRFLFLALGFFFFSSCVRCCLRRARRSHPLAMSMVRERSDGVACLGGLL